jgi:hypothetical protein
MPEAPVFTGNEFLDGLLAQQPARAVQPRRGQNYNYPLRWYLLPDGRVVQLQADPQNRAYYEDKGCRLLSDNAARGQELSEVAQYERVEYPKLLAEQREKAAIINAIRRAGTADKNVTLEDTFDGYTLEQLRDYLKQIKEEYGKTIRVIVPRNRPESTPVDTAEVRLLNGVETSDTVGIEDVQAKARAGYDPLAESRRRRPVPA